MGRGRTKKATKITTKPEPIPTEGGLLLKQIMEDSEWSQVDVERMVGAATGTVGRLTSGERRPGRELSEQLRLRFGISPLLWDRRVTKAEQHRKAS